MADMRSLVNRTDKGEILFISLIVQHCANVVIVPHPSERRLRQWHYLVINTPFIVHVI